MGFFAVCFSSKDPFAQKIHLICYCGKTASDKIVADGSAWSCSPEPGPPVHLHLAGNPRRTVTVGICGETKRGEDKARMLMSEKEKEKSRGRHYVMNFAYCGCFQYWRYLR